MHYFELLWWFVAGLASALLIAEVSSFVLEGFRYED